MQSIDWNSTFFLRIVPYFLYFMAFSLITSNTKTWNIYKWFVALPFLISLFKEYWPMIRQKGKGTPSQKLESHEEKRDEAKLREPNILDIIVPTKNISTVGKYINVIFIVVIILILILILGKADAERQKEFLVLKNPSNIVVLKIYGDKYICAPFDPNTKTVEKSLYIIDSQKQDALWFDWQKVGPLNPKK